MKAGGEKVLGGNDIESLESTQSREEVEVRCVEAARVSGLVRDRHDHMLVRSAFRRTVAPFVGSAFRRTVGDAEQQRTQAVLVDRSRIVRQPLELRVRRRQELGLPQQALGAAVGLGVRCELRGHVTAEIVQRLLAAPELVVKPEHFEDRDRDGD